MGVSTRDIPMGGVRSLSDEPAAEAYVPPEGTKWQWLIGRRDPIDSGGPVVRYLMKALYWTFGLPTSAYFHEQGIATTPEKAQVLARKVSGGYAIRLPVDGVLPEGRVDWKYKFTGRGLFGPKGEQEVFECVASSELSAMRRELREWREGVRETEAVALLRRRAERLTRLAEWERRVDATLADLDARLRVLEGRPVTIAHVPHRASVH